MNKRRCHVQGNILHGDNVELTIIQQRFLICLLKIVKFKRIIQNCSIKNSKICKVNALTAKLTDVMENCHFTGLRHIKLKCLFDTLCESY